MGHAYIGTQAVGLGDGVSVNVGVAVSVGVMVGVDVRLAVGVAIQGVTVTMGVAPTVGDNVVNIPVGIVCVGVVVGTTKGAETSNAAPTITRFTAVAASRIAAIIRRGVI
jgi:hypothetical protein